MAGVTPEIKTKFTLDGVDSADGQLAKFSRSAKESLERVKKAAASTFSIDGTANAIVSFDKLSKSIKKTSAEALKPFKEDLAQTKKALGQIEPQASSDSAPSRRAPARPTR